METKATGRGPSCAVCSRTLTADGSIALGIGPICRGEVKAKYGAGGGASSVSEVLAELTTLPWSPCLTRGCLVDLEGALERAKDLTAWIREIGKMTPYLLPEERETLAAIARFRAALRTAAEGPRAECGHVHAGDLAPHVWALMSWMKHRGEPWIWSLCRRAISAVPSFYRQLQFIMAAIGCADEAAFIREAQGEYARNGHAGRLYRRSQARYRAMYPLERVQREAP